MKKCVSAIEKTTPLHKIGRVPHPDDTEPLHVHDCPWCHDHHIYMVRVSRLPLPANLPEGDLERLHSRNQLIRYFRCPATGNRFKGILTLFHSPTEVIRNIEVLFVTKNRRSAS